MHLPFFYGWVIVAIVMVAGVLAAGVSNITMAVVLKPISEDLGWSRTLMAAAITVGSLSGGLLSPLFGPLADRLGPRVLLPLGGALVGLLAVGVSASTEPWQFYATFIPARALTEFLLCGMIAFTAGQLVSCHAAAGYGISCDGDAAGLGGIVFSLSVFCHSLRLAQCVSRPRHSTLVVGGDSRINILTPPARGSRIVSRRHSSERSPA